MSRTAALPARSLHRRQIAAASLLLVGLATWLFTPGAHAQAVASTDRLIVKYRDSAEGTQRRATAMSASQATHSRLHAAGVYAVDGHYNGQGAQVLRMDRHMGLAQMSQLARAVMAADPNVLYAEPDVRLQALATPSDPMYAQQWDYFEATAGMRLPAAWDLSTGTGVVVGVLDTGYRPHADLVGNLVPGYDFVTDTTMANDGSARDADASDPGDYCSSGQSSWHGTHVAGTVAALANNGIGTVGVAYGAKVLPVRVMGCNGGYNSDIADGIVWAAGGGVAGVPANTRPAKVINMSLGGQAACSTTLQNAINTARGLGATIVVAAGNSNMDAANFSPANCKGVITVGAVGRKGGRAPYSNFGAVVDVSAPGGNMATASADGILSTLNAGRTTPGADSYAYYQGTSMAAPHVAGVAALMLARNPKLTPDEVDVLLRSNARAFAVACSNCGSGMVDAAASVAAAFLGSAVPADVAEVENNNTLATAQSLTLNPVKVRGSMASSTDVDFYKFSVPAGATVKARLMANMASNYNLDLRNSAGTVLVASARALGLTDPVSWKNATAAAVTVYARVGFASGAVGAAGTYSLELAR
jgi:serine protease